MTETSGNYVYKDRKRLRCGYTTGTCAAIAARASVRRLITGLAVHEEEIMTPKGIRVRVPLEEWSYGPGFAQCAVRKDAGDDHDVTDGILIFARAEFAGDAGTAVPEIFIEGGEGIGTVTKAGLDQPVGAAAINSVPRRMIKDAVSQVLDECSVEQGIRITVSAPEGRLAAEKTFNPILGIEGGISILGTSGIVEPMSEEALVDTIRAQLRVLRAEGRTHVIAVPGNMGTGFLIRYLAEKKEPAELPENVSDSFVVMSNFIGKTVDMAGELGFSGLLIAGHIGKLVKLGNGIMNTHSREADGRMDTLLSCALSAGAKPEILRAVQKANTTDEAAAILKEAGLLQGTISELLSRIHVYLKRRAADGLSVGVLLFGASGEYLGMTEGAEEIFAAALRDADTFGKKSR